MTGRPCRRTPDAGLASVLVLSLSAVLALVSTVAVALAGVAVTRHRAASAADLAALAASDLSDRGAGAACAAAARIVESALGTAGELTRCQVAGPGEPVEVEVRVRPGGRLGTFGRAAAAARAGP